MNRAISLCKIALLTITTVSCSINLPKAELPPLPAACEFVEPMPKLQRTVVLRIEDGRIQDIDSGGTAMLDNYLATRKALNDLKRRYGGHR